MIAKRTLLGMTIAGAAAFAIAAGVVQPASDGGQDGDAARTPPKPGEKAPDFTLKDTDGKEHKLSKYLSEGKVVVLEWFNPDCPWVVKHHHDNKTMKETYEQFKDQGVVWLAINSAAPGLQGHGADHNAKFKKEWEMPYPILLDEEGTTGRAYGATHTPHMYVISAEGTLLYAGAICSDRSRTVGDTIYVREALRAHFAGETIETKQTQAYGCTVKYARERRERRGG
jgi:peroxiredoxin